MTQQDIKEDAAATKEVHQFIEELKWRGLLHDSTDEAELSEHLSSSQRRFYIGFDPTAPSLTIGNLMAIMMVIRGIRAGLNGVVLLGGGTGLIGDPSGKSEERTLLKVEDAQENVARHRKLMSAIIERAVPEGRMPQFLDNYEWLSKLNAIEFLRDVGKYFSVSEMMRRDSVSRRLNDPNQGLSYTEFSYSLLQSYDFMVLCKEYGVTMQMGASDQWGNMVAGIDYVRRILKEPVHALTCPLLLRSDGSKFGKTEQGAIWLTADRTSPYKFYQFLLNLSDDDARIFARYFSLESKHKLDALVATHDAAPHTRPLQKHIALELTTLVHGKDACDTAITLTNIFFSGNIKDIDANLINQFFEEAPSTVLEMELLNSGSLSIVDFLVATKLLPSKGQAKKHLENNGVELNGTKTKENRMLGKDDLLYTNLIMCRNGKQWMVARFEG